ncbi:MAG: signal peptidase II [Anaerolineae bacterium]|nr:signal peptidase II [Anaerolineae bacterium]
MSQILSTEQNRIREELLGLIDSPQPPQPSVFIGLFGPPGSGKTTMLDSFSRMENGPVTLRSRNHRRVMSLKIDATIIPRYMLPWQYVLSQVLDRLDEQAMPSEIEVIKGLRGKLVALIRRDPKMTAQEEETGTVSFIKQFRQAIPALVASNVTHANNVLVVGLDHLDKIDAVTTADLLDAAAYFLRVPGVAVLITADEGALVERINTATESTDGSAQLRSMLQARLELPARVKAAAAATLGAGIAPLTKPRPVPSTAPKATTPSEAASVAAATLQPAAVTVTPKVAPAPAIAPKTEKSPASAAVAANLEADVSRSTSSRASAAAARSQATPKADRAAMAGAGAVGRWVRNALASGSPIMLALIVFLIDRATKILIRLISVEPPGISIVPGWLRLEQYFATTTANGLLRGSLGLGAELVGLFLALILMIFSNDRNAAVNRSDSMLRLASFGLIVGTLTSILLDRLWFGGVLNFIHLGSLPVFNLAHVMLLIGELMLIYSLLRTWRG